MGAQTVGQVQKIYIEGRRATETEVFKNQPESDLSLTAVSSCSHLPVRTLNTSDALKRIWGCFFTAILTYFSLRLCEAGDGDSVGTGALGSAHRKIQISFAGMYE